MEQLWQRRKLRQHCWCQHRRQHEHKAIFIQLQIEITDIFCIGNHISVEIILKSVNTVNIDSGYTAVEEQTLLIVHPVFVKTLYGIIRRNTAL